MVRYSTETVPAEAIQGVNKVFDMAKQFAYAHANFPSTAGDEAMPKPIKDKVIKAASSNTAFSLMSHPSTRYLLIAKVISQWLVKHVFKINTFQGYDQEADGKIEVAKNSIYQSECSIYLICLPILTTTGTPAQIRCLLLNTIAKEVSEFKTQAAFQPFLESLSRDRGNILWSVVQPMMHQRTSCDWEDLYHLLIEAHKVALSMYAGAVEYRFDFAESGHRYDKETMQCMVKHLEHLTPQELEERLAIVTLGATPCVIVRSNSKDGNVTTGTIAKGMVLVKLG